MARITINIPDCPGCCGFCGLPSVVDVAIEGLESCGCVTAGGISASFATPTAFNGSFTGITLVPDSGAGAIQAFWRKEIGTVSFNNYPEEGCVGEAVPSTAYGVIFVLCAGGLIYIQLSYSESGYPTSPGPVYPDYIPILNGGFLAQVDVDVPEANTRTCDGVNYLAQGTGTLTLP